MLAEGDGDGFRSVGGADFLEDDAGELLDAVLLDVQVARDLLVGKPAGDEVEDQLLAFGQPLDLAAFRKALKEMNLEKRPEDKRVIVLDAAKGVDYQAYYEAMAAISGAGGIVGIMTEESGK